MEYKCLYCNRNYQKKKRKTDEILKKHFLLDTNFLIMISISSLDCYKKVLIHTNTWMIEKTLVKLYNMKNNILPVT